MNLYIMNKNFEILDPVIDFYKSTIWTNRYYKCGDFEMYIPLTSETKKLIKQDYYIYRESDFEGDIIKSPKIIEKIETISNSKENYLLVSGRDCSSILEQRIIYPTMILKGKLENCISLILNDNLINPINIARKINFINFINSNALDIDIDTQITGDSILKYLEDICNDYKIGYRMDFNKTSKKFILKLYKGIDRTDINNNAVIISKEYDNVIKNDYMNDKTTYKNMGIVAGAGEGIDRKVVYLNDELSGIDRREIFIDAKDLQTTDEEGQPIPDEDYMAQLEQRGSEKLSESASQIKNSADIDINGQFVFNRDFYLGDVIINKSFETSKERIIETIESDTASGIETELTFEEIEGENND